MKKNKILSKFFVIIVILSILSSCATYTSSTNVEKKIKIAFIGDSITEGVGLQSYSDSFPSLIQEKLGPSYYVRDFSNPGSHVINTNFDPYNKTGEFVRLRAYEPDIAVIMLGTNDAVPFNFVKFNRFEQDYMEIVNRFKYKKHKTKIYLCTPPHATRNMGAIVVSNIPSIAAKVRSIARKNGFNLIDVYALTNNDSYYSDGVHLSQLGAHKIADIIIRKIK